MEKRAKNGILGFSNSVIVLSIVAIVAIVGIVILVKGSYADKSILSSEDAVGDATRLRRTTSTTISCYQQYCGGSCSNCCAGDRHGYCLSSSCITAVKNYNSCKR